MSINIQKDNDSISDQFYNLTSMDDLAELLEIKVSFLRHVLYDSPVSQRYVEFTIPKKTSTKRRIIHAPNNNLKIIQRKLSQILNVIYRPRCSVHGFLPADAYEKGEARNIVTNANVHKKQRFVFNIDLEDFFPSIHFGRVQGLFMSKPYSLPRLVARKIAQIATFQAGLPQGAPTSPVISNMICNSMDSQLLRLAQSHRCYYTRYADDITFSTSMKQFPRDIGYLNGVVAVVGDELKEVINQNGFKINTNKIRLQPKHRRQSVTGLTVNQTPNVTRKYIRQIRAMLYAWEKWTYKEAEKEYRKEYANSHRHPDKNFISFRDVVLGKIEYLGMVRGKNDTIYRKFLKQLSELPESNISRAKVTDFMTKQPANIFLSYAREDFERVQRIYQDLKRSNHNPWMDKIDMLPGEQWEIAIENALEKADMVITCLSEESVNKRGYVQREFKKAIELAEQKLDTDIFLIPLRLDDCEVPRSLKKYNWLDYFSTDSWERLTSAIKASQDRMMS